ncbi:cellulose synthase/poly-beta-1,6-N-acetylglucosamine synthase-like glycosyltransferase [Methanofollis sp. W23]|uniref:pro-sigmaK processing inhibitor BofA family protein n=1 Tax=Methanofollis sp. W23 TaxID=2817849 RepID=UPI001AE927D7|nr:pro-sigmaK processing inhibitor BofA family protein [Methanofollis sp. W23]MBP2147152.1 cellulose synthase/poly-beta-1,6-N-acetylglucosamine synthase-like glycosyltransferase [Methanofollis sp. W23]
MLGPIIGILLALLVALLLFYFVRKGIALVINAIAGIVILFLINLFNVMSLFGRPDIPIDIITVVISALGGIIGVIIVVILHLLGIPL